MAASKRIISTDESVISLAKELIAAMENGSQLVTFCDLNKRSKPQNDTFHMWCGEISKFFKVAGRTEFLSGAPMNPKNIKENLKRTYLGQEEVITTNLETGEIHKSYETRHTSDLLKGEMFAFMRLVEQFANDYDIKLTIPVDSEYYGLMQESQEKV